MEGGQGQGQVIVRTTLGIGKSSILTEQLIIGIVTYGL